MGGISQISTITSMHMWSLWVGCSDAPSHHSQMLYCAKQWPQSGRAIVVPGRNRSLLRRKLHIVLLSTVSTSVKLCRYVSAINCHQGANFHFVQKPSNEQYLKNSKHKQNETAHEHLLQGRAIVLVTHNRFATGRDLMWIEAIQLSVQGSKRKLQFHPTSTHPWTSVCWWMLWLTGDSSSWMHWKLTTSQCSEGMEKLAVLCSCVWGWASRPCYTWMKLSQEQSCWRSAVLNIKKSLESDSFLESVSLPEDLC